MENVQQQSSNEFSTNAAGLEEHADEILSMSAHEPSPRSPYPPDTLRVMSVKVIDVVEPKRAHYTEFVD